MTARYGNRASRREPIGGIAVLFHHPRRASCDGVQLQMVVPTEGGNRGINAESEQTTAKHFCLPRGTPDESRSGDKPFARGRLVLLIAREPQQRHTVMQPSGTRRERQSSRRLAGPAPWTHEAVLQDQACVFTCRVMPHEVTSRMSDMPLLAVSAPVDVQSFREAFLPPARVEPDKRLQMREGLLVGRM